MLLFIFDRLAVAWKNLKIKQKGALYENCSGVLHINTDPSKNRSKAFRLIKEFKEILEKIGKMSSLQNITQWV